MVAESTVVLGSVAHVRIIFEICRERFLWNWGITSHSLYLTFCAASLDEPSIGSLWRVRDEPQPKVALFHFDAMKLPTRLRDWQPGT